MTIRKVKVSEGGISGTVVDPKKIFYIAIENHASPMILVIIIRRVNALQVRQT